MRVLDWLAIRVMRRVRRRRRELELEEAHPGLGGYGYPDLVAERHTAQRGGAGGLPARRRVRVAVVAVTLVAATSVPAYLAGATSATAVAAEEVEQAAYEEAAAEYHAAQVRENAALSAAVAAYSAEREASGEAVPEEEATEQLRERGLTDQEVAEELEGIPGLLGKSHEEAVALEMWEAEPLATEVAEERIRDYEDASAEASEARVSWENAWDERSG